MKKLYFILLVSLFSLHCYSFNDSIVRFSDAINKNISTYISESNKAYLNKDYKTANILFDSLVQTKLIGTHFDGFSFKRIGKKRYSIDSTIKTPVMLFTYASWNLIEKGEVSALKKLAQQYKGKIKIIVLFWGTKNEVKKIAKKFNNKIDVCYANERSSKDLKAISMLKNSLGFPTSYYLDANKNILSIKKRSLKPTYNIDFTTSFKNNYTKLDSEVSNLLILNSVSVGKLAKN